MEKKAKQASLQLQSCSIHQRNKALEKIHELLVENQAEIINENEKDKILSNNKRLDLSGNKFHQLKSGVLDVLKMADPIGKVNLARKLDHDLDLYRVSCPIGVILVVFEARPVTKIFKYRKY